MLCMLNSIKSQTLLTGVAFQASSSNAANGTKTVNGNTTDYWSPLTTGTGTTEYITYYLGEAPVALSSVNLNFLKSPYSASIYGSNDNISFTLLSTSSVGFSLNAAAPNAAVNIATTTAYKYIRVANFVYTYYTTMTVPIQLAEVTFYGLATTALGTAVNFVNINTYGRLKVQTNKGFVDIGNVYTNTADFSTDMANFVFNKPVYSYNGIFSSSGSNNLSLQTAGTTQMTIETNGNVTFAGKAYFAFDKWFGFGPWQVDKPRLLFTHNGTNGYIDYMDNLYFRANKNSISALTLYGNGTVGIGFGTTYTAGQYKNQGYKLAVNGGIICEEMKIVIDVPDADFVFEDDYNLKTLPEVETFIKENKHLPNIPSAEQFKKEGYKVGDMDEMLLRKVEELTLYVIELNKQVEALKKENEKLKK